MNIAKAHAYGNDFLLVPAGGIRGDLQALARAACQRHSGVGADGLILYTLRERGAIRAGERVIVFNTGAGWLYRS